MSWHLSTFFLITFFFSGCSFFIEQSEKEKNAMLIDSPKLHLVFSHNISGETHPCGCRNFPLGGLPQVYGLFQELKKTGEVFYVDTGDTFFPSSVIPDTMHSSLGFGAENLASGLDLLGLRLFVPGDQDFALGANFLNNIDQKNNFSIFVSNYTEEHRKETKYTHPNFAEIKRGSSKIYLISLVHPEAVPALQEKVTSPLIAMKSLLSELRKNGYEEKNPYHRLIVLSHAGIDNDVTLAENFPMIDWIIGSHSQSFLRFSQDVGKTKIVQALSKNHYIGDITIDLTLKNSDDTYTLHEIRDELKDKVTPNPLVNFIDEHKKKMNELQLNEQAHLGMTDAELSATKFPSANSCLECHKPQGEFWKGTAHSVAYLTLIKAKEENNLSCVQCHSHGLNSPQGFKTSKELFLNEKKEPVEQSSYRGKLQSYTESFNSLRKLSTKEVKKISNAVHGLDKQFGIKHNFSNVQCLNCHSKPVDHPFAMEENIAANTKKEMMKNKCLSCHTTDQSPEWYEANSKNLNPKVYQEKLKKVSCPLGVN